LLTKLHFSRFEFKYVLSAPLRREIERELAYFLQLDPYVADKPNAQYSVRSLYFDGPAYAHYYEKIDGMMSRAKFRLRTYTDRPDPGCATFLEIKGRYGGLAFKHRAPLRGLAATDLVGADGATVQTIVHKTDPSPVLEQFRFELERRRLQPCMLIDYRRRPYVTRYAPEFRLTFDEGLVATHTGRLHPQQEATRAVLRGYTIMEVKFRYHVPSWFHRVIQSYDLRRVSISKYCKGIEAFGLTPHLE